MKIIVKKTGESIEAAMLSDSFFEQKDPQVALTSLKRWERGYKETIAKGKEIVQSITPSPNELRMRWDLGDLIFQFLERNQEQFELQSYEASFARDLELSPTEKREGASASSDVDALLALRKTFARREIIDPRISWNLFYYAHETFILASSKGLNAKVHAKLVDELLEVANYQARLAIKGNGAAKVVARRLVEILTRNDLL